MKARVKTLFSLLLISFLGSAQQIAVTFDDAPFGASGGLTDKQKVEAFEVILQTLTDFEIKATFFVTTSNLTKQNAVILDMAVEAGHQLANHTDQHYNFNSVTAAAYIKDIARCNELAGKWLNSNYFRYSMLRQGDTRPKRDSVYRFLEEENMRIAPVTIDNNEWIFNRDYYRARNASDKLKMQEIGENYLEHMKEMSIHYRDLGRELTGSDVKHILLIHLNPINATYLDDLLTWYKTKGWNFITLDEAMEDPIHDVKYDLIEPRGLSVIEMYERHLKKSK